MRRPTPNQFWLLLLTALTFLLIAAAAGAPVLWP